MKLLLITQKVDRNDPSLGFMEGWVEAFARSEYYESVTVICLEKGVYSLPSAVRVFSLGKEERKGAERGSRGALFARVRYAWRFVRMITRLRSEYDTVFVHMNPEYVILGGLLWRMWGTRVALWYNHRARNLRLALAARLATVLFYTSPASASARYSYAHIMPVGIDTELFTRDDSVRFKNRGLLALGRIAPVKRLEALVHACHALTKEQVPFTLDIYGDALERDRAYEEKLRADSASLQKKGLITFFGGVENRRTPALYSEHGVVVNLTGDGSFDKTILEAMACESMVLVANTALARVLPPFCIFDVDDEADMAAKLTRLLAMSEEDKAYYGKLFREYVVAEHTLSRLMDDVGRWLNNR